MKNTAIPTAFLHKGVTGIGGVEGRGEAGMVCTLSPESSAKCLGADSRSNLLYLGGSGPPQASNRYFTSSCVVVSLPLGSEGLPD